jgi:DNA-directed RNA polymerase sigma subunit (sigma70/sigma32)
MMEGHFSVATIAALSKILRICRNLRHVIGREPTPEEIAGRLGMPGMPSKTISIACATARFRCTYFTGID